MSPLPPSDMPALGRQILAEFTDCDSERLKDEHFIEQAMNEAALRSGASIVGSAFHPFSPYGVSGVVIIAESHMAIHTWPEYAYAAVDIFTCGGDVDPWIACQHLREALGARHASTMELRRGCLGIPDLRHKAIQTKGS